MKQIGIPAYRGSYAANIRLFCPMFLDESVDKIIYLDADTIVTGSLKELTDLKMGNDAIAMVLDSLGFNHKLNIGMKSQEYYYNSGVILFDMKNWTKYHLSEAIKEYVVNNGCSFSSPDQDLLNVVCKKYIKLLSPIYNMQPVHIAFSTKDFYRCYYSDVNYLYAMEIPLRNEMYDKYTLFALPPQSRFLYNIHQNNNIDKNP